MFENIISNTSKTIVGNVDKIKLTLSAIISEGSILIEDYPGSGKTTFAKAITSSLGLNFKRIQFTSDLLPSDVLGFNILSEDKLRVDFSLEQMFPDYDPDKEKYDFFRRKFSREDDSVLLIYVPPTNLYLLRV